MRRASYSDVRADMRPGDVLAFGGKEHLSNLIKWFTRSTVSHVGVVLRSSVVAEDGFPAIELVDVIESTSLNRKVGVQINRMSERVAGYHGELWWLPLDDVHRDRLNTPAFLRFLLSQEGKGYDALQAIGSAIDFWDDLGAENVQDFSRFFCSELVIAGLCEGGVLPEGLNASEFTPVDLVRLAIYREAVQIKGDPRDIARFNTVDPTTCLA